MDRNFYDLPRLAEVVNGAKNFSQIVGVQYAQLGLTQPQVTAFAALVTSLDTKYQASQRPDTRTPAIIEARNVVMKSMKQNAVFLSKIIIANPAVTNDQLVSLGLLPRRSRGTNGVPTSRPVVELVSMVDRTAVVNVHDTGSSTKRGKAAGTAAAWFYTYVGVEYPSDPGLWNFEGSTSRSKFEITFPSTLPGGTQVWVCAAWINTRQEAGPVSLPITTYLQGGGSTSVDGKLKIAA